MQRMTRRTVLAAAFGAAALARGAARRRPDQGRRAAEDRLRLRQPHRRRRLDLPARHRAQGNGKGAGRQGDDQVHRERAGRRRRRARHPRARAERPPADLHHVVRLHEPDDQGRRHVPEDALRARHRLQERGQRRHLQRALLRGPLPRRHRRGQDDQVQRRRLRRRVPDPRGGDGHQRVHPRHEERQPEGRGQGRLGQLVVRPGQGAPGRRHADLAGRRRASRTTPTRRRSCRPPRRRRSTRSPTTPTCRSTARTRT